MTKKLRQSNIELLRLVCMFMVLCLHANFLAFGNPDFELESGSLLMPVLRVLSESLCIVAVNTFVMISGWFGIKPSLKGFCNFLWQVYYFVAGLLIIEYVVVREPLPIKCFFEPFGLYNGGGWFVAAYMCLYIIAPILNSFIERATNKQFYIVLASFFIYQTAFGETSSVSYIEMGYSPISFIGLYLLSAFLRRIHNNIRCKLSGLIWIFISCAIFNTIIWSISSMLGNAELGDTIIKYINPIVILQSSVLLLVFSRIMIPKGISEIVNWIAASCFAAYLLHIGTHAAMGRFLATVKTAWINYGFCGIIVFLVVFFAIAILIDQPRKFIWNKLIAPCFDKKGGGRNILSITSK